LGIEVIVAAQAPFWLSLGFWYNVLLVLVGLGLVIFVHELGHFVVAKLCGVKCEKFYLGFDIFGLRLVRFQWGETEYGVGILPLGGYVKMLGQEDNPARLREELERARARRADASKGESPQPGGPNGLPSPEELAAEEALFDPRSYLAKSVPSRMAIISAGVVMNVVFAFLCAMAAYSLGVFQIACGVGEVAPGEAAWRANLRVGDRIERIGDKPVKRFSEMQAAISVGDIDQGVPMVIRRPGVAEPVRLTVVPDRLRAIPTIGISNPRCPVLNAAAPVVPGTPAAQAEPAFQGGDRIVGVDGRPVRIYADYHAQEALHSDKTLRITVERTGPNGEGPGDATRRLSIDVAPRPVRTLGLVLAAAPLSAVQPDSPAARAGIHPGDRISRVDGQPVEDPMRLPFQLRRLSQRPGAAVKLTIQRPQVAEPLELTVTLRQAPWYEQPLFIGNGVSVPVLGVAYQVENVIEAIEPDSPAAAAGLKPGDRVVEAEIVPPDAETLEAEDLGDYEAPSTPPFQFAEDKPNWPSFFYALQESLPGSRVKLTLDDGRTVTLKPARAKDWFNPNRGFLFEPEGFVLRASSAAEAFRLGGAETARALTLVFRFLHKLGTKQVSPRALGGPVSIAKIAYRSAERGIPDLLIFLCLISANLAVINFLPIPVLDGGHMVFLSYEGICGKPPSERIYVMLSYLGLILIIGLMIFVTGLDIGCIARH